MPACSLRTAVLVCVIALPGLTATLAGAQDSNQNNSLWKKIENAANQGNSKQPAQPQQLHRKNSAPAGATAGINWS